MIQVTGGRQDKFMVGAALSRSSEVSAGRQNLLSSLWSNRSNSGARTMPNGDPPSLMLWGDDESGAEKRSSGRAGKT